MKLTKIFSESIKQSDDLVRLYESIISKNIRSARKDWTDKVFSSKILPWGKKDGLWRISKSNLIIIGKKHNSSISSNYFSNEYLEVLLRSAFVLAMATIDKLLHEALLNHFYELVNSNLLDSIVSIPLSESYRISQAARIRKGKGGQKKPKPGIKFRALFIEKSYEKSLLSTSMLEQICAKCGKDKIFNNYKNAKSLPQDVKALQKQWSLLYKRRNSIAHETDIIRKQKAKKIHFNNTSSLIKDIKYVRDFGEYLSNEL